MKEKRSKECLGCRGHGTVGDAAGAMAKCNRCGGAGRIFYWEDVPSSGGSAPTSDEEVNWWWFLIGAAVAGFVVLPMDTLSPLWKGGIVITSGCLLGVWWKQLFMLLFGCVALLILFVFLQSKA